MDGSPGSPATPRRWLTRRWLTRGWLTRGWLSRRWLLAVAVVGVVLVLAGVALLMETRSRDTGPAAGPAGSAAPGAASPAPGRHVYLLQPSGGSPSRVALEVAADEAARERGLSNRAELPAGSGMAFLFPGDTRVPFWMKDTLVPLQIAFVGGDGRVVGLFEMPPCRADPCPTYAPARPYRYAVELRSGAFTAAGIREGGRVVPEDPSSLPAPS